MHTARAGAAIVSARWFEPVTEGDMLAVLLVVVCAVFRIVPHLPNVAPVGATAVLAGRTLRPLAAIAVTLGATVLADLVLAWLRGWSWFGIAMLFVYGGFIAQVVIARALRRVRGGAVAAAIAGASVFFVVSNLGVWLGGSLYPPTLAGLWACYGAALPFFAASLVGDVLWTIVLVLTWGAVAKHLERHRRWVPADALAAAPL